MNDYRKYYHRSTWQKLFYICMGMVAFLSKLVPKRRGLFLFGSMSGFAAVDNSLYLYLNVSDFRQKYYILKNKDMVNEKLPDGSLPVYAYSMRGILLQLLAERVHFTHGIYDFVPYLIWGSEKHNLWHGVPIKEIGPSADWRNNHRIVFALKLLFNRLFSYVYYMSCDYVYCPAAERVGDYERYFQVAQPKIIIRGQARNTYAPVVKKERKILYAPTYRPQGFCNFDFQKFLYSIGLFDKDFEQYLRENRCTLVLRAHPIDRQKIKSLSLPDYIEIDDSADIYQTLNRYPAVITDYSSIYYDCKELAVPCFILAPDVDQYNAIVGMDPSFVRGTALERAVKLNDIIPRMSALLAPNGDDN